MTLSLQNASLAEAMPRGSVAIFDILAESVRENVGYLLMTVLVPSGDAPFLMRVFSTNQEQYPLGTADPVEDSIWFRRLFSQGEAIIANDAEAIEAWLPGFDAYVAQGYGSLANVPIVISGTTIGLVNLMDQRGHYTAERIAALRQELPLAALAILAGRMQPVDRERKAAGSGSSAGQSADGAGRSGFQAMPSAAR